MTEGVIETKDTRLYFCYSPGASSSDPDGFIVLQVACPTGIPDLTSGARPRQDMTCLSSQVREYFSGLADPGELAIPINFIPRSESHQALIAAKAQGANLVIPWMVVFSDQTAAPTTVDSNDMLVSPGPTSVGFKGYVSNFAINAQVGDIWRGTVTIQVNSELDWNLPAADLP